MKPKRPTLKKRRGMTKGFMYCPDCGAKLKAKFQGGSGIPLIVDMCPCGSQKLPQLNHPARPTDAQVETVMDQMWKSLQRTFLPYGDEAGRSWHAADRRTQNMLRAIARWHLKHQKP